MHIEIDEVKNSASIWWKNVDASGIACEAGIRMPTSMPAVVFSINQKALYHELEIKPLQIFQNPFTM